MNTMNADPKYWLLISG